MTLMTQIFISECVS